MAYQPNNRQYNQYNNQYPQQYQQNQGNYNNNRYYNQEFYGQSGNDVLNQQLSDKDRRQPQKPNSMNKVKKRFDSNAKKSPAGKNIGFGSDSVYNAFTTNGVLDKKSRTKRVLKMKVLSEPDTPIAMRKTRGTNFRYRFIIALCLIVICIGLGIELWYLAEVSRTSNTFTQLSDQFTMVPVEEEYAPEVDLSGLPPIVDFVGLQSINPDISSWLYIPGTTVNYPVLTSPEEEKYLNLDMYGNYSISGSIFTDFEDTLPLEDENHIVLYGHHMIAPIMFNNVSNYADYSFFQTHKTIYYETPSTTYVLMPIGTYIANPSEYDARTSNFVNGNNFQQYLDERLARCDFVDTEGLDRRCMDKLFTMITCTSSGDARVVVECVPVEVYPTSYIPNVIAEAAWQ